MKTMQEYETLKIYGMIVNVWKADGENGFQITRQIEVEYKLYDFKGNKIGGGTEDFSLARWNTTSTYRIFGWDGEKRNAGNQRWFRDLGCARINPNDRYKLQQLTEIWNGQQATIQLRKI